MRRAVRFVVGIVVCAILIAPFAGAASAQGYLDDPPLRFNVTDGQADFDGKFEYKFTAPEFISEPINLYVIGTDDDGEPFEWVLFVVTPPYAGLTWSVRGANMLPGSDYVIEARYAEGTAFTDEEVAAARAAAAAAPTDESDGENTDDETDEAVEVLGTTQLPADDSSNTLIYLGGGLVLAVLVGAGIYGSRMRTRY